MNYIKHYNLLIERAKKRQLTGYVERHHVVPKCIGGTDEKSNLVELTPEEHYVAHQLLVKLHPDVDSLVYAANKMTVSSKNQQRNNKRYGWLKRRYQHICKKRVGNKNPSYGKSWYYSPETFESGKFLKTEIPSGWVKGRIVIKEQFQYSKCESCGKTFKAKNKFCSKECRNVFNKKIKEEKSRIRAYDSWNKYINGNYKSPRDFYKCNNHYRSHQHMYRDWLKYVKEYKVSDPDGTGADCKSDAHNK